jgi:hypothetical protein
VKQEADWFAAVVEGFAHLPSARTCAAAPKTTFLCAYYDKTGIFLKHRLIRDLGDRLYYAAPLLRYVTDPDLYADYDAKLTAAARFAIAVFTEGTHTTYEQSDPGRGGEFQTSFMLIRGFYALYQVNDVVGGAEPPLRAAMASKVRAIWDLAFAQGYYDNFCRALTTGGITDNGIAYNLYASSVAKRMGSPRAFPSCFAAALRRTIEAQIRTAANRACRTPAPVPPHVLPVVTEDFGGWVHNRNGDCGEIMAYHDFSMTGLLAFYHYVEDEHLCQAWPDACKYILYNERAAVGWIHLMQYRAEKRTAIMGAIDDVVAGTSPTYPTVDVAHGANVGAFLYFHALAELPAPLDRTPFDFAGHTVDRATILADAVRATSFVAAKGSILYPLAAELRYEALLAGLRLPD